jgi:Ca2+-binding RTX toxin-like protein
MRRGRGARTMRAMAPSTRLLLATALACAALPAAAHADTASFDGTTVHVQGSDGNETITLSVDTPGFVTVTTDQAGDGCTHSEATGTQCPLGPGGIDVAMGGGNDTVSDLSLASGALGDDVLRVDLGAGDDKFNGGPGAESVVGGAGNDELKGAGGDDKLDGGDGNDKLNGQGGRDQVLAGNGDDVLDGDEYETPSADVLDGGPGNDRVEGWSNPLVEAEHPPISVTLDNQANDGRPGEGDDVRSIERITSNTSGTVVLSDADDIVEMWANIDQGASTIRTNGGNDKVTGGNHDETIDGGAGDDTLEGGYGNDTIVGGPGRDRIYADMSRSDCGVLQSCSDPYGNDTIDVRDGEADTVSCGVGTDKVLADAVDTVAADCETVERAGAPGPGTPTPGGGQKPGGGGAGPGAGDRGMTLAIGAISRSAALKRGIPVTVTVAGAGRLAATAREGRRTIAAGAAKAKKAGKVALRLAVGKQGRKALRRHGRHRITVRVTFTLAGGGKAVTASRTLVVK